MSSNNYKSKRKAKKAHYTNYALFGKGSSGKKQKTVFGTNVVGSMEETELSFSGWIRPSENTLYWSDPKNCCCVNPILNTENNLSL